MPPKRKSVARERSKHVEPIKDIAFADTRIESFEDLLETHIPGCDESAKLLDYLKKCYAFLSMRCTAEELRLQRHQLEDVLTAWDVFVFRNAHRLLEPIGIRGRKSWCMLMYFWLCGCHVRAALHVPLSRHALHYARVRLDELAWIGEERVIDEYSQTDFCNAMQLLLREWRRVKWSEDLFAYVEHLMRRCATLVAGERTREAQRVHDHKLYRRYDPNSETYSCNDDFIFQTSVWFLRLRAGLYAKCSTEHERFATEDISLEHSERTRRSIFDKARSCKSSEFMKQFRVIYMDFMVFPGEVEKHSRDQHGEISTSSQIVAETRHQRQVEYVELKFLRNTTPSALLEDSTRLSTPSRGRWSFLSCVLALKVVDSQFQNRFQVMWMKKFVLFYEDFHRLSLEVSLRGYPVILENLNDFDVFYKRNIFETSTVEAALYQWALFIERDFQCCIEGHQVRAIIDEILDRNAPPSSASSFSRDESIGFEEPMDADYVDF